MPENEARRVACRSGVQGHQFDRTLPFHDQSLDNVCTWYVWLF